METRRLGTQGLEVSAALPSTKRVRYVEENAGAAGVDLTKDEPDDIEAVFPKGATAGERYADMSHIDG